MEIVLRIFKCFEYLIQSYYRPAAIFLNKQIVFLVSTDRAHDKNILPVHFYFPGQLRPVCPNQARFLKKRLGEAYFAGYHYRLPYRFAYAIGPCIGKCFKSGAIENAA